MFKTLDTLIGTAKRLWAQLKDALTQRNDRAVAAWGSSLQYKRPYTNPDSAKAARQANFGL